jgi:hypothetical protein
LYNIINSWRAICQIKLPGGREAAGRKCRSISSVRWLAAGVLLRDVTVRESERGLVGWLVRRARGWITCMMAMAKALKQREREVTRDHLMERTKEISIHSQSALRARRQRQPKSEWGEDKKEHQKHKRLLMSS